MHGPENAQSDDPQLLMVDRPRPGVARLQLNRPRVRHALNMALRKALASRLSDLSREMAILMVEHHLEDALAITDRITVLYLGEALFTGSAQEVRAHPLVQKIYLG